jgi:hypothetical protein
MVIDYVVLSMSVAFVAIWVLIGRILVTERL